MAEDIAWPKKTRELHSHHFDSTAWNDLQFRDDDIIVATYAKAGTTWMQQIIGQLLFDGDPDLEVAEMSPWLDLRVPPKEVKLPLVEAQTHRRFLKTHLPVDALPIDESRWDAIVEHCSFEWMKKHATKSVPLGGAFWDAGAEVFINKGVNGRWRDILTAAESEVYKARAEAELGKGCARWLATGEGAG